MTSKKRRDFRVETAEGIAALTSPLRMEIVQAFETDGRLTVQQLSQRLGKPRGSLYYHVGKLVEMGVIVEVDRQLKGKKYESSFEISADRIVIDTDPDSEPGRAALSKLVRTITRQAAREFERALESSAIDGNTAFEVGRRQRAWLTKDDVVKVDKLFAKIEAICNRRRIGDAGGRLYSVTSLIVPLEPEPEDTEEP